MTIIQDRESTANLLVIHSLIKCLGDTDLLIKDILQFEMLKLHTVLSTRELFSAIFNFTTNDISCVMIVHLQTTLMFENKDNLYETSNHSSCVQIL